MPIAIIELGIEDLEKLSGKDEGHFLDFKSKRIKPAKLSNTLCSFANADGGEIYIGLEDPKSGFVWDGFLNEEEANAHIQVIEKISPLSATSRITFLSGPGKPGLLLHVELFKSSEIRSNTSGDVYVRRGAQNLPVTGYEAIERIRLNKGIKSQEDSTISAETSYLTDSEIISSYMKSVVPSQDPTKWLTKQRLIVDTLPTIGGAILFADEPQILIPKASIKIYRYQTSNAEGTRETLSGNPISIDGCAYDQIKNAVEETKKIVENIPSKSPTETTVYPTEAIHEIITNAVIHRDYSLNDDIHVRIFDNRIEVVSPGVLPAHVTVQNILDERFSRNPKIVRLLNKFDDPPNKDVGEGLNTAFQAMKKLKLRDPIIQQNGSSVWVILRHEKLGTPESLIIEYLRTNDEINNATSRSICYIGSENTMKRVLQGLLKKEIIERIPGRPQNKTGYKKGAQFPI